MNPTLTLLTALLLAPLAAGAADTKPEALGDKNWAELQALSGACQWEKLPPPAKTPEPEPLRAMPRAKELPTAQGPYQPNWESIARFKCPEWFADAKFGIWTCYSPVSIGYGTEHGHSGQQYYSRLYWEGSPEHKGHIERYGHPSQFGYKDIIPLWKAEQFDPDALMKLFKDAGARYFFTIAVFCDNYDLWDSKYHRWNSVQVGPKKDMVALWKAACEKQGMKWGVTEHLAPSYFYFKNKGSDKEGPSANVPYDSNEAANYDLYHPPHSNSHRQAFSTQNVPDWFQQAWYRRVHDLVTTYQPDMLDTDDFGIGYERAYGFKLVSDYYNLMLKKTGGQPDFLWTGKRSTAGRGLVTMREFGLVTAPTRYAWQRAQPLSGWFWSGPRAKPRPAVGIIDYLAECVSKNGNLLLAVAVQPDGMVPEDHVQVLREIGAWLEDNGEAIYGTRPWRIHGEGSTPTIQHKPGGPLFKDDDVRFTMKGDTIFALCMGRPKESVLVKSLGTSARLADGTPKSVKLLGHEGRIEFEHKPAGLEIRIPAERSGAHGNVFAIRGFEPWDGDLRPTPQDEFFLHPLTAALHGVHLRDFDPNFMIAGAKSAESKVECIADWFDPKEWISWDKVRFLAPGRYSVKFQAGAVEEGVSLVVGIGDRQFQVEAPTTKSRYYPPWLGGFEGNPPIPHQLAEIDLGEITIDKPAVVPVTVRAGTSVNWPGRVAVGPMEIKKLNRN
jgi:alpha-L-fucosidase